MPFTPEPITAAEVAELRELTGAGLSAAKQALTHRRDSAVFQHLISEGSLEEKVDWLLTQIGVERGYNLEHPLLVQARNAQAFLDKELGL